MSEETKEFPQISIKAQYIKDLSLEIPHAPAIFTELENVQPDIKVHLDLNISKLSADDFFEVALNIHAETEIKERKLFLVELVYASVVQLTNITDDTQKKLILSTRCPELIFPYARKIIADVTKEGGLMQPLMIDPINFEALFFKEMQKEHKEAQD